MVKKGQWKGKERKSLSEENNDGDLRLSSVISTLKITVWTSSTELHYLYSQAAQTHSHETHYVIQHLRWYCLNSIQGFRLRRSYRSTKYLNFNKLKYEYDGWKKIMLSNNFEWNTSAKVIDLPAGHVWLYCGALHCWSSQSYASMWWPGDGLNWFLIGLDCCRCLHWDWLLNHPMASPMMMWLWRHPRSSSLWVLVSVL